MIKYPNELKKNYHKFKTYGNRGMTLEAELNQTNEYYLEKNIAVVYKKPTPIQIVKQVDGKITEAFFKIPSTTDYNGLYDGKYIDFEAKETTQKTSFPLSNIHNHQIRHMNNIINHKGLSFLIVRFTTINETYLLFTNDLLDFLENNTRKSIPLEFFKQKGYLLKEKLSPRIDYIEIIKEYGGKYEKN